MIHGALPPPTVMLALRKESENESRSVVSTFCDPKDYTVHGSLQARILDWVAVPFSRGSSQPGGRTRVSRHCRQILYQLSHQGRKELRGKMSHALGFQKFPFILSLCSPSLHTPERLQHHILGFFCSSLIPSFQFLIIRVILAFLLSSRFLRFITITRDFTAKEIGTLTPGKLTTCHAASTVYILHCLCLMLWYFRHKVSPASILLLCLARIPRVLQ